MAIKERTVLSNSLVLGRESDSPSDVNVSTAHLRDYRGNGPFTKGLRRRDLTAAFIARFHTKYQIADGCWLWQAGKFPRGYGMVNLGRDMRGKQRTTYAHRVAYLLAHGEPIEAGLVVMHTCDVPACVNPAHLRLGTQGDNVADAARKGHYNGPKLRGVRKLTDAQVAEIRQSTDRSVRLAERFHVTTSCICQIRNGLRRKAA